MKECISSHVQNGHPHYDGCLDNISTISTQFTPSAKALPSLAIVLNIGVFADKLSEPSLKTGWQSTPSNSHEQNLKLFSD